ncbi:MAG: hypothetical protein J7647_25390 [Cyanobacteria bacterium SBLK]|nr:hypothetical protein [Cyanobacteria bacterium SBLK]
MLLKLFRSRYPQGSLSSELLQFEQGKYVVRVTIHIDGAISGTGLGAADTIEEAEDRARSRALALLNLEEMPSPPEKRSLNGLSHLSSQAPAAALPFSREEETIATDETQTRELPPSSSHEAANLSSVFPSPAIASSREVVAEPIEEMSAPDRDIAPPPSEPFPPEPVLEQTVSSPLDTAAIPVRETAPSSSTISRESIDFSDVLAQTNIEIKRLQWTQNQGREFLLERYGKRSRQVLTDDELLDFLEYLKSQ